MEGREGFEPGHLSKTKGLFLMFSMVWCSSERVLAMERMKVAAWWQLGDGCDVSICKYSWNLDIIASDDDDASSWADDEQSESKMNNKWKKNLMEVIFD